MYEHSLPSGPQWLTTADVARILERTTRWVRWLARTKQLASETTRAGQRMFLRDVVERYARRQMQLRARTRRERLRASRLVMVRAGVEPRQLRLRFGGRDKGERSLPHAEAKPLQLVRKTA